mgnify:CR=1 FL=1
MQKIIFKLALPVMALALTACHTTEANYKNAYDKAVERTRENAGEQNYDLQQAAKMAYTEVVNGDSVRLLRTFGNIVDGKTEQFKKYSVIVAEFDQIINARSYRDRLQQKEGFESYLVYTNKDKKYCVAVQGFDEKEVAVAFLTHIKEYMKMKVLVPRPWILQRL